MTKERERERSRIFLQSLTIDRLARYLATEIHRSFSQYRLRRTFFSVWRTE